MKKTVVSVSKVADNILGSACANELLSLFQVFIAYQVYAKLVFPYWQQFFSTLPRLG